MSRVFLSYSYNNEDFVNDLYRRLSRDGIECFFDQESIAWGANWVVTLEKGIDECEAIILVLSPAYCQSEWAKLERTSSIADDPAGLERKLLPLFWSLVVIFSHAFSRQSSIEMFLHLKSLMQCIPKFAMNLTALS